MPFPKIFIGSSAATVPIAEKFKDRLEEMLAHKVVVDLWSLDDRGQSRSMLEYLTDRSRDCDFAALFLTKDDLLVKRERLFVAARDNCVFEAGLFIGAFSAQNRDQERCFLLTSLNPRNLPTDLAGIRHLEVDETPESSKLERAAQYVKQRIIDLKALARPELSCIVEKELMEREQPATTSDAGELEAGSVVVVSLAQPSDTTSYFADRVLNNLKAGVEYIYYLAADKNLKVIAQLVQSLAAAGGAGDNEDDQERRRQAMIKGEHKSTVMENLHFLKKNMTIYLLPSSKPFEVIIHNAHLESMTSCYLLVKPNQLHEQNRFVLWSHGDRAASVVKHMQKLHVDTEPDSEKAVFRSTVEFKLGDPRNEAQVVKLKRLLQEMFDVQFHKDVLTTCFAPNQVAHDGLML